MKGLSEEQYVILVEALEYDDECFGCEDESVWDSSKDAIFDQLMARGLVREWTCPLDEDITHISVTPLGLEAIRIHEALRILVDI